MHEAGDRKRIITREVGSAMRMAQLASLVVFGSAAWIAAPWLTPLPFGGTLAGILAIHLLRVFALVAIQARRDGFPVSKAALTEIVVGDLLGAAIALAGIIALLQRLELGVWLAWLVVVETVADLAVAIRRRRREPLKAEPSGLLWFMLAFYVPLMVISLPLLIWLLVARAGAQL